jgi:uncharacterized protein (UPF0210 family)
MRSLRTLAGLCLGLAILASGVAARAEGAPQDRPRIRAVTAYINVDRAGYAASMGEAVKFLATAKTALNGAGFTGANGRVTTQPFPQYTQGMKQEDALALIRGLHEIADKNRVALNIGPAMLNDSDDIAPLALLPAVLAGNWANSSIIVADEKGVHWRAVREAARLVREIARTSPNGNGNFNFAATAMMKPYGPYFPGSWHNGEGRHFAIAMETANLVNKVFSRYHDPVEAQAELTKELSRYTQEAEAVAVKIAAETGWIYEGIDATPAPGGDYSIGTAFEAYLNAPIGSPGSMTAAGIITRAVQSTPVKRTGYSGLMIPVMEDAVLAKRWAEKTYNIDSILAWSAVCAGGVDTVPLAGDTTEQQIARMIGDVTWLAYKWNKPLAARLMPAPGKVSGDMTAFTALGVINTKIQ